MLAKFRSRFTGTSTVKYEGVTFTCQSDGCWYGIVERSATSPGHEFYVLEFDTKRNHLARVMARGPDKASIQTDGYAFQLHRGTAAGVHLWMDKRLSTYTGGYWLRVHKLPMDERPATSRGQLASRMPSGPAPRTQGTPEQRAGLSRAPGVELDANIQARYELDSGVQYGSHELSGHGHSQRTSTVYEMSARRSAAELTARTSAAELAAGTILPEQRGGRSLALQRGRESSRSPSQHSQRSVSFRPEGPVAERTLSSFIRMFPGRSAAVDQAAGGQGIAGHGGQLVTGSAPPRASRPSLRRHSSSHTGNGNPGRSSILSFASKGSTFFTARRPSHGQGGGAQ